MAIAKIQKGDKVKVISGGLKNHVGVVTKVVKKTKLGGKVSTRVTISGVPQIAKYRKANQQYNVPGQMLTTDRTVDISNVQLVVGAKDQVSRVAITEKDGKRIRVYKSNKKPVEKQAIPTPIVEEDTNDKETK